MPSHDFETWDSRFHWGLLRTLGNSRLVTSSVVWLFVVPIAAKLLTPLAGQHTLDLSWVDPDLNEPIAVTVALPFSWQRFYLMSWLFVIGQGVYLLACPTIVRRYGHYGDYRRDHAGPIKLREFLASAVFRQSEAARQKMMDVVGGQSADRRKPGDVYQAVLATIDSDGVHEAQRTEIRQNRVFDAVRGVERHARRLWLWLSGVFFAGGLALFAWVVIEGVVEVCKLL